MALVLAAGAWWVRDHTALRQVHTHVWNEEDGYRWASLPARSEGDPGFEKLDNARLGIRFQNTLTEDQIADNRNLLNGSGVAVGDVTGNGFPDLYLPRLDGSNRLYENLGGWTFRDVTDEAGVALPEQFSTGAVFADLDGDAHLDLVVSANGAPNRLFLNDGSGRFSELAGALDTGDTHGSTSIALADVTGNGALDLYIANYKERSIRDIRPYEQEFRFIVEEAGDDYRIREPYREHYRLVQRDSSLIWFEQGEEDLLFLNDGEAGFTRIPLTSGIFRTEDGAPITEPLLDWGLHARFQDIDGDRLPDLYVANDFESPDRVWLNGGDGSFHALPSLAKRKGSVSSMSVDFSDIDRDGHLDFFVVEMLSRRHDKRLRQMATTLQTPQPIGAIENEPQYMGNTLFMNRGDGTWAEVSEHAGVRRSDWSWATLFQDVDLDGYEDIIVATGHHYDVQDLDVNQHIRSRIAMGRLDMERSMLLYPPLEEPNVLFRNRGNGTFEEVTQEWGLGEPDVSHGIALADMDNSGYPDLVVSRLGREPAIYRNTSAAHRVQVRLRGRPPNTRGTGATIHFRGGEVPQSKEVVTGGTYLSGSQPTYHFATGAAEGPFTIEVEWRGGGRSVVEGVLRDRIYEIREEAGGAGVGNGAEAMEPADAALPFFEDVSDRLDHVHHENPFDDFAEQPLLPYRLSRLGPGMSWFDADGDGLDDLFVASGAGGSPAWFRNLGDGTFEEVKGTPLQDPVEQDRSSLVGWREGGAAHLLAGVSTVEDGEGEAPAAEGFRLNAADAERVRSIPGASSSTGALAVADYTGDGRLDLFVGGRLVPGRYPEAASSRLYRNEGGGRFVLDEENSSRLAHVGLVTGAAFTDLDGDGAPELLLARHWGSLQVWKVRDGTLEEVSSRWGIDGGSGWWTGIATGDLNGNGRLDIVAANWGTNHPYAATSSPERPARIHYGDLDGSGSPAVIESYTEAASGLEVPRRGFPELATRIPFIEDRIRTFEQYAGSSLEEIVGGRLRETSSVEAGQFEHTVFWNTEEGFRAEPLPARAQWAPAFHVAIADLSGDGHEDVFLSQNFFSYRQGTPRSDAGRGLWLRGDGSGGLAPVPGHESGILAYGEQRGAALSDFDGDGRVDVALSQNGGRTRLFRNRGGEPGLRVHLGGTEANPAGIGASLRLVYPDGMGPLREIRAGSGYWSQDSAVQVLGRPRSPEALWVRWPRGEEIYYELPDSAREVRAGVDGSLQVVREPLFR